MLDSGSKILLVALTLLQARPISGVNDSFNLDLVILIHGEIQWWTLEIDMVKDRLKGELPKFFNISENGTRLALVANVNGTSYDPTDKDKGGADCPRQGVAPGQWKILQSLTGNINQFKTSVDGISQMCTNFDLGEAFRMIRERVFAGAPTRPRAILLISNFQQRERPGGKPTSDTVQSEAAVLREAGVVFYVFFETASGTLEEYRPEYLQLAADPTNLSVVWIPRFSETNTNFNATTLRDFSNHVKRRICNYSRICFFDEDRICKKTWHTRSIQPMSMVHTGGDCSAIGIPPPVPLNEYCAVHECEKVCDKWREWSSQLPDCRLSCGKVTEADRVAGFPWKEMENCPHKYQCPPCPPARFPKPWPLELLLSRDRPKESSSGLIVAIVVPIAIILIIAGAAVAAFLFVRSEKGRKRARRRAAVSRKKPGASKKVESRSRKKPETSKKKVQSKSGAKPQVSKKADSKSAGKKAISKKGKQSQQTSLVGSDVETGKAKANVVCKIPTKKGKRAASKKK